MEIGTPGTPMDLFTFCKRLHWGDVALTGADEVEHLFRDALLRRWEYLQEKKILSPARRFPNFCFGSDHAVFFTALDLHYFPPAPLLHI